MGRVAQQQTGSSDISQFNCFTRGATTSTDQFAFARGGFGEGTSTNPDGDARTPTANGGTSTSFVFLGSSFSISRGGLSTQNIVMISFNTSNITVVPSEASITIKPGSQSTTFTNVQDDHKWIAAAPSSVVRNRAALAYPISSESILDSFYAGGDGAGNLRADFTQAPVFEGFVSGSSFATQGRFYTEPLKVSGSLITDPGASGGMAGAQTPFTVTLNENALQDMAKYDLFFVTLADYSSYVLNVDMKTSSPSPGSTSEWLMNIPNDNNAPVLNFKKGREDDSVPIKSRIENDFTLNTYEDISVQRNRFVKDGVFVDQVPFLLGTKGPLSLRGRQFDNNGKPISTTVEPPNTSKD